LGWKNESCEVVKEGCKKGEVCFPFLLLQFGFFLVLQASNMPFPRKMQSFATKRERNKK
jgi:hypothetical protein